MKKTKMKLGLNKKSISSLETSTIIGGVSGRTCELTRKYYVTCQNLCERPSGV